jgi:CRISPR-associated exonuclease Cas4
MWAEEDYISLSWLQHYGYCRRRAALVILEQSWADNLYTAEGHELHDRVDQLRKESRVQTVYAYALPLVNEQWGLRGRADLVEYVPISEPGLHLAGKTGSWVAIPIEYKRGRQKHSPEYALQICGQALCLEEMLDVPVREGAIYYAGSHKRVSIHISDDLRSKTLKAIEELRDMIRKQETPAAVYGPRCTRCSLADCCMPKLGKARSVERYLRSGIDNALEER